MTAFNQFLVHMVQSLDDAPETVGNLLALLGDNKLTAIKIELAFVKEKKQPIHDCIKSFQKQSGGPRSPMGHWEEIKNLMGPPTNGTFSGPVRTLLNKCSGTLAAFIGA